MLNSSDGAGLARPLRKILLATVVSFALVGFGSGVASAQEDPTTPSTETSAPTSSESSEPPPSSSEEAPPSSAPQEEEPGKDEEDPPEPDPDPQPEPAPADVEAGSICDFDTDKGSVEAKVTNPNDTEAKYDVILQKEGNAGDPSKPIKPITVGAGETEVVTFEDVAPGDYLLLVLGNDGTEAGANVPVDRCAEIKVPIDDPLQVFVRCDNGKGLITIRVFNAEGELRTFTVSSDELDLDETFDLPGEPKFVIIERILNEEEHPDGTYTVKVTLKDEKGTVTDESTETVTVACAPTTPAPQPRPAPSDDDGLASTGAAVGGMALLGVVALGLGGGLIVASRRRKNAQPEETEA